ncbi:hypothetical protein [Enterococcus sp. DIV1059_2]|uniref:hypothetical protein n=1 Tax=Enterococcus sp. DIV1059_2 TaxID=2774664 RepID=UPI003F29A6B4
MDTVTITRLEYDRLKEIEAEWKKRQEDIHQNKSRQSGDGLKYELNNNLIWPSKYPRVKF